MFIFLSLRVLFLKTEFGLQSKYFFSDLSNLISSIFQLLRRISSREYIFLNFLPIFANMLQVAALYRQSNPELEYEPAHDL